MITFNDTEQAKLILNDTNVYPDIKLCDLKLIAKYYDKEGLDIAVNLKNYIKSRTYTYDEFKYDSYIDKCLKYCNKYKLMGDNKIPLTKKENEIIKGIDDDNCKRLMFIILMYAKNNLLNTVYKNKKLNGDKLIFSGNTRELFRFAQVPYKSNIEDIKLLKQLEDLGLVTWGFGNWCEIIFYDKEDTNVEIWFNANDNIIDYAIGLSEEYKLRVCSECGNWFYVLKNNTKTVLCPTCNKKNKAKKSTERSKKYRNANK